MLDIVHYYFEDRGLTMPDTVCDYLETAVADLREVEDGSDLLHVRGHAYGQDVRMDTGVQG